MATTKINAAGLASPPRAHLGFPGENARAFGKRRRTLRSGAFADKRDKAHRARVWWPHKTDAVLPRARRAYRASDCWETSRRLTRSRTQCETQGPWPDAPKKG